jgi:hypothetical protein
MLYTEMQFGVLTGVQQTARLLTGNWPIHVELCIDAKSVYDNIVAKDPKIPAEQSLIVILQSIREQFGHGLIKYVWWVDTLDMLADALTKGIIKREEVLLTMRTGLWKCHRKFIKTQTSGIPPVPPTPFTFEEPEG